MTLKHPRRTLGKSHRRIDSILQPLFSAQRCIYLGWLLLAIVPLASAQDSSAGSGQAYPARPVRVMCATPGASGDFSARLIAQGLSATLGQPLIVDNRGGYASIDAVTKALPN
jgi:hypothetical protein